MSSNGRVFSSPIESNKVIRFSIVPELSDQEIICVPGRVFGYGLNKYGKLYLGKDTKLVSSFTEISSLAGYEIRAANAGSYHSIFETIEGQILSCGYNYCDQLLQCNGAGEDTYSLTDTTISGCSTFFISGNNLNTIIIDSPPPPNTPNMSLHQYH